MPVVLNGLSANIATSAGQSIVAYSETVPVVTVGGVPVVGKAGTRLGSRALVYGPFASPTTAVMTAGARNVDYEVVAGDPLATAGSGLSPEDANKLAALEVENVGTEEAPIWQLLANIIPRTNTLANLLVLSTGGGELASATDAPCIVLLSGPPGSGQAFAFSPMAPGTWDDESTTLQPAFAADGGSSLTLAGGDSASGVVGDVTLITPQATAGSSGGNINLRGGDSSSPGALARAGGVDIRGGTASGSNLKGGEIALTAGFATAANSVGGAVSIIGGRSIGAGGTGGSVTVIPGRQGSGGVAGKVALSTADTANVLTVGPTENSLGFFGATAVVKQTVTGSRGGNAALASLLTALAAHGLITNSTSA